MKIGEVIKQFREEHNISQRAFARHCDLSNAQISWLEVGVGSNGKPVKPTFDTVRKVAKGMGIPTEMLIMQCEDFELDLTDTLKPQPAPDEDMILQAYRSIPVEHRIEAMTAILAIKTKYEK